VPRGRERIVGWVIDDQPDQRLASRFLIIGLAHLPVDTERHDVLPSRAWDGDGDLRLLSFVTFHCPSV
jgi:hypothetical protein